MTERVAAPTPTPVRVPNLAVRVVDGESPSRKALRRFLHHRLALVSLALLSVIVLMVLLAPILAPRGPTALHLANRLESPSSAFILGTDQVGRDIWARVLYGGRVSLVVGVVAVAITFVIGVTLGLISGFYGGGVDLAIQRLVEIISAIPALILIISLVSVLGANIVNTMIILGLTGWGGLCRFVRGQILSIRERDYILAARSIGARNRRLILAHVLPNVVPFIIVLLVFDLAHFILTETGLSYLGLGVQQPTPSWGNLVGAAASVENIERRPWLWLPAGLAITLTVLAINFIGDALRDALDPYLNIE